MEHQSSQQHHQLEQEQNMIPPYTSIYSSSALMSQPPSFMVADHKTYPLPFSPNSIQKHLQHQDKVDPVEHW